MGMGGKLMVGKLMGIAGPCKVHGQHAWIKLLTSPDEISCSLQLVATKLSYISYLKSSDRVRQSYRLFIPINLKNKNLENATHKDSQEH